MQKILGGLIALALVLTVSAPVAAAPAAPAAATPKSATGPTGQVLTVDASMQLEDGQQITVKGRGYDLKVGIYATFCVLPERGKKPESCGHFDITGQNNQAVWISSNAPFYAALLAKPFDKVTKKVKGKKVSTGSFSVQVPVSKMIGDKDCTVVKCAIVTRADHTRSDYRKADVVIPVSFK
jgi:hypothetical protein